MPAKPISNDINCACGYNLRGLPINGNCPECGLPVLRRVRFRTAAASTPEGIHAREEQRRRLREAVADSPYRPEAFLLVLDVLQYAVRVIDQPGVHMTGQRFCELFCEYISKKFPTETRAIYHLASLGIDGSEDVGRIIFRMVETGRLNAAGTDSIDDFKNVFTLSNVYARTK